MATPLAFQRQEGFFSSIAQVPGLDDGNLITLGTGSLDPVTEPEDQPKGPDITDRKVTPLTGNLSAALSRIQDRFTERAGTPTAKTEKPAEATTVLKRPSSLRNVVTQGLFGHRKDRLGQQPETVDRIPKTIPSRPRRAISPEGVQLGDRDRESHPIIRLANSRPPRPLGPGCVPDASYRLGC